MTIPKECKRIAEVDFPIAVVSRHAAREKSIRHGHPSTLHLWWARRPLAACRSMLMALLLPDPCDPACPPEFAPQARDLLAPLRGRVGPTDLDLRQALLAFIGDFADWDHSAQPLFLEVARGLVRAAHPEGPPLVVDPFAGGGSIPLEALRIGCDAFASDLNPVACLIEKVMLADIPRQGPGLADELRRAGAEIKAAAERELAEFYPADSDGARPIAYLWARTVRCEAPNCGAEIPLARSFWLSKKARRKLALRYHVDRASGQTPKIKFEIFTPRSDDEVPAGTVSRAKARCISCGTVLAPDRVRAQLAAQRGGADAQFSARGERVGGATMLAVVTLAHGEQGRHYRLPTKSDYAVVRKAQQQLGEVVKKKLPSGLSAVPDEPLPVIGTLGFRVQRYGMLTWGDLFTARQKLALVTLLRQSTRTAIPLLNEMVALSLSRCAEQLTSLVRWRTGVEAIAGTFGRQALPMMWDFAEIAVMGSGGSSYIAAVEWIAEATEVLERALRSGGSVQNADASEPVVPDAAANVWFTDPPYYDAVPYADLADFFFVWLRRALPGYLLLRDPFDQSNPLTPKLREIVQDESKSVDGVPKDSGYFEDAMSRAFIVGRRALNNDGLGCIVFAHKTTEGWEALLSAVVRGGWTITGSWPIATERPGRLRSQNSAALATSVHLVCRPRPVDAPVGDWSDVYRELPNRVADWMERLQSEGVRGADLVFACIGPALEIYSRYSKVVDPEDREIPLGGDPEARDPHQRGYLAYVWEVVGRAALEQILGTAEARARNGAAGALEEDARLTALFLWTLQSTSTAESDTPDDSANDDTAPEEPDDEDAAPRTRAKGFTLVYDVVRRFAQPLGIHLEQWDRRIIDTDKGVVRLIPVAERAEQLFGPDGAQSVAARLESVSPDELDQLGLFPAAAESAPTVRRSTRRRGLRTADGNSPRTGAVAERDPEATRKATTLDRVHAAMLLQRSGRTTALRRLLAAERDRGPDFLRLSNALSALYPPASDEKRLLDAMLLAAPR